VISVDQKSVISGGGGGGGSSSRVIKFEVQKNTKAYFHCLHY
jgi:hypothetical protein